MTAIVPPDNESHQPFGPELTVDGLSAYSYQRYFRIESIFSVAGCLCCRNKNIVHAASHCKYYQGRGTAAPDAIYILNSSQLFYRNYLFEIMH